MSNWDPGHIGERDHSRQDTLLIIPLPPTGGLAGLGLFGLAARRRRPA